MKRSNRYLLLALGGCTALALAHPAVAATFPKNSAGFPIHAPTPWEWWFQPAASPIQKSIDWVMQFVLWIMFGVVLLVAGLLAYVMVKFHASKHPIPSTTTHNTLIEVVWTLVPALLLIIIFVPSLNLIYQQSDYKNPYMTVRVTGHQWYWEYDYLGAKGVDFTSYAVPPNELKPGEIKQLSADHPLVLPANQKIVFQITSGDVLHSFFIPSLGVQRYAIPGQYWHQWTEIDAPGIYYGECNQICGMNHDNMPIEIVALPMAQFQAWLTEAKADAAQGNVPPIHKFEVLAEAAAAKSAAIAQPGIRLASSTSK
ncbi:MAG: cytochrome c oxidase subunit II [Acidiphilium sp.]|nr:cytochrome c oxidase subunit II [Acidiphilium sp.]MDD4936261.1 cytochrome c oxidase subunit II [Acidiphilium sp.]